MAYSFNSERLAIVVVDEKIRYHEDELRKLRRQKIQMVRKYYFGTFGYKHWLKRRQKTS